MSGRFAAHMPQSVRASEFAVLPHSPHIHSLEARLAACLALLLAVADFVHLCVPTPRAALFA